MRVAFFRSSVELRRWFAKNHGTTAELWVGYYKKETGKPSVTWPESVEEALCVGWIDGIRKARDAESYTIRFTRRKRSSTWSAVNIAKAQALIAEGRMTREGLAAFEARKENRSGIYSYEQRGDQLADPYGAALRRNKKAWSFFQSRPASYRKAAGWWVVSAKKDDTRRSRLARLIEDSAVGRTIPQFTRKAPLK